MKTTIIEPHKSSLGLDANGAALIAYIAMVAVSWLPIVGYATWVIPLVILFVEKNSKFVKFQAAQALLIGIVRSVLAMIFAAIVWVLTPKDIYGLMYWQHNLTAAWIIGAISVIVGLAITALVVYLAIMAYGYKQVELPIISKVAAQASSKLDNLNINPPETTDDSNNQGSV